MNEVASFAVDVTSPDQAAVEKFPQSIAAMSEDNGLPLSFRILDTLLPDEVEKSVVVLKEFGVFKITFR